MKGGSWRRCRTPISRAGTPVDVIDVQVFSYTRGGATLKGRAFKVRILQGEFKNRLFFVRASQIIRTIGAEAEPAVARPRRRRSPAPIPAPAGDLILTDLAVNPSATGNWIVVQGRFQNISVRDLRSLRVRISLEDRSGQLVKAETAYCEPGSIAAGGSGSFQVMPEADTRYARVKVEFMDREQAIPWVDRSGKDAHK